MSPTARNVVPIASIESELPYRAWNARQHRGPTLPLRDSAPGPLEEEPEQARRLLEFTPALSVALPVCGQAGSSCDRLLPGVEIGASVFYRLIPHFAVGATARLDAFSLAQGDTSEALRGSSTFFGVAARVYGYESGALDPYLELSLGAGSLEMHRGQDRERVDFAPAGRIAAGIEFSLNPWLRVGPALAFSRYAPRAAERCSARSCVSLAPEETGIVRGTTSLGVHFTFATGERL